MFSPSCLTGSPLYKSLNILAHSELSLDQVKLNNFWPYGYCFSPVFALKKVLESDKRFELPLKFFKKSI